VGGLPGAEGRVPTPYGPIEVDWKRNGDVFVLRVKVPNGTRGNVGLPVGANPGSLIVNGHGVKSETGTGRAGYAYVRDLLPGTYEIDTSMDSK
jgi:alpha-L-rhamnosidase